MEVLTSCVPNVYRVPVSFGNTFTVHRRTDRSTRSLLEKQALVQLRSRVDRTVGYFVLRIVVTKNTRG